MIVGGVLACVLFLFGVVIGFLTRMISEPTKTTVREQTSRPMTPKEKARFDEAFTHADRAFEAMNAVFTDSPPSRH